MSRPIVVYTDNELKRYAPDWCEEVLVKHRNDARLLLHNLGCDVDYAIEVQRDLTSRNRFNEIDTSTRYVCFERTDKAWLLSGSASHEARIYSEDKSLTKEIRSMTKGVAESKTDNKEND